MLIEHFVVPLDNAGHLFSVTMASTGPGTTCTCGCTTKLTMKKLKTAKSDHIIIDSSICTVFIKAFLTIHNLADQYCPGVHLGPGFKMWWLGSS